MGKALMAYVNRYSTVDRIGSGNDVASVIKELTALRPGVSLRCR